MKQFNITICHKESSFTILNQHIPLIYSSKDNDTPSRTVNLVYTDGIIPVPFSSLSQTYRGVPAQLLENKGFPLKSISSFSLAPGTQKITDVGISFDIPRELYGHIVYPSQVSWFEPLFAPGFFFPWALMQNTCW